MATHATLFIGPHELSNDYLSACFEQTRMENLKPKAKRGPGRPRGTTNKDKPTMATTQVTPAETAVATKDITLTVFDLATFDDVKLTKTVTLPTKPSTLEEALAACGNNAAKLLDVIHEGLISETVERERENMEGFFIDDDEETPTPYTGKFADSKKTKQINAAVLSLAKMNGFDKTASKEKKREIKDRMRGFLRENPAMLGSIQG